MNSLVPVVRAPFSITQTTCRSIKSHKNLCTSCNSNKDLFIKRNQLKKRNWLHQSEKFNWSASAISASATLLPCARDLLKNPQTRYTAAYYVVLPFPMFDKLMIHHGEKNLDGGKKSAIVFFSLIFPFFSSHWGDEDRHTAQKLSWIDFYGSIAGGTGSRWCRRYRLIIYSTILFLISFNQFSFRKFILRKEIDTRLRVFFIFNIFILIECRDFCWSEWCSIFYLFFGLLLNNIIKGQKKENKGKGGWGFPLPLNKLEPFLIASKYLLDD